MILLKKLIFAPLFLIVFAALIYRLTPLLSSSDFIIPSADTISSLLIISALLTASSLLFILFATIAPDWKFTIPVALIASVTAFIFIPPANALFFAVIAFVSLLLINLSLDATLKSYLTFKAGNLLGAPVRNLSALLTIAFCVIYFLSASKDIAQNGFQIPDSLIDTTLQMVSFNTPAEETSLTAKLPEISPEQITLLKQNPDLLKQYGLNPSILDNLDQPKTAKAPQNLANELIKQTVKDQIQNMIKPYINFIPGALAVMLFLLIQTILFAINLFVSPLLWIIFFALEQTGFIKFTTEMREVKKMVV